jgi:hypothetical protein
VILEAAREFKTFKDAKNANHWWDDECKSVIQEKNEARRKCLIRKTRANSFILLGQPICLWLAAGPSLKISLAKY